MPIEHLIARCEEWLARWREDVSSDRRSRTRWARRAAALEIEIGRFTAMLAMLESTPGGPALVRAALPALAKLYAARREIDWHAAAAPTRSPARRSSDDLRHTR